MINRKPTSNFHSRTAVAAALIEQLIHSTTSFPETFRPHHKLSPVLERLRRAALQADEIDWPLGEALAFGTLVSEGIAVRLSGQDSGRGTFSQRHLVFYDKETGAGHVPMQHISPSQGRFEIVNSPLSEYAALGFEYGYSVADPQTLVIWEAQFGDFANGAQIMIDNFISSGESKWRQPSGLVMMLPHGYEGQGPEHSSARIERFLALSSEDNWSVVNCTTPAQLFHLLRRQVLGGHNGHGTRKPLVVFTPKSLLRDPRVISRLQDFTTGGFVEILDDPTAADRTSISRVVFCSGKIYYDLLAGREKLKAEHVALVRIEQLYPFVTNQACEILAHYPAASEMIWVQEEPHNMGTWRFIREQLEPVSVATHLHLGYVARPKSSSPATGFRNRHDQEQAEIINCVLRPGRLIRGQSLGVLTAFRD